MDDNTVIRGGYGLFWAPWQYTQTGHGTIGFTRTNEMAQSAAESEVPLTSLENPYPAGLVPPTGSSLGILTGLGGDVEFIDQNKGGPKVHQYAIDVQRQLPGQLAVSLAYMGSTGVDIGFGGSTQVPIELNQIDPSTLPTRREWKLGCGGPSPVGSEPVLRRGRHGRACETPDHSRRPVAAAVSAVRQREHGSDDRGRQAELQRASSPASYKRMDDVWGGHFSYTWSRMRDNQWGELSTFVNRTATPQNYYDLDAEYGVSVIDTPHRVTLSPIVRIPGPSGPVSGSAAGRLECVGDGRVRERAANRGLQRQQL